MSNYKHKYEKYKTKYFELQYGSFSTKSKHEQKSQKVNQVLHLVADSAKFVGMTKTNTKQIYAKFPPDFRKYINKIALALKPNQWIQTSSAKFKKAKPEDCFIESGMKPSQCSTYFSKGDWIFSEANAIFNKYVNMIEVDYTDIALITNLDEASEFTKKYMYEYKVSKKDIETYPELFNTIELQESTLINWEKVRKDYPDGIAIIPNNTSVDIEWYYDDHPDPKRSLAWLQIFDVSTLILWNHNCILNYKTILNTKNYIGLDDFKNKKTLSAKLDELTNAIINNMTIALKK